MSGIILVDSAETFLQRPRCAPDADGVADPDSGDGDTPADSDPDPNA